MIEMSIPQKIAIWALPVLFAITVHEVAHGWVASKLGDQTARLSGRLTLNPMKHIDLFGTIIVPIMLLVFTSFAFGWAKPVPVDARNLRSPKFMALVAIAGPLANFIMALLWACVAKLGLNLNAWFGVPLVYMGEAGIVINLVLAFLNCIPIPPLDGGRVLVTLLPGRAGYLLSRVEPYGFLIILLLLLTGILSNLLGSLVVDGMEWINALFNLR